MQNFELQSSIFLCDTCISKQCMHLNYEAIFELSRCYIVVLCLHMPSAHWSWSSLVLITFDNNVGFSSWGFGIQVGWLAEISMAWSAGSSSCWCWHIKVCRRKKCVLSKLKNIPAGCYVLVVNHSAAVNFFADLFPNTEVCFLLYIVLYKI